MQSTRAFFTLTCHLHESMKIEERSISESENFSLKNAVNLPQNANKIVAFFRYARQ